MPAYRLAIFDFDGTLGDTMSWFLDAADVLADRFGYERLDRSRLDELRKMNARDLMKLQKVPAYKLPRIAAEVQAMMKADTSPIHPFPGARDMLAELKARDVTLAVVSSNAEDNVRRVLGPETCALVSRFDCGASIFGKASKFRKTVSRLGFRPGETISVGDEIRDIEAAREAGLATGAVTWGYTLPESIAEARPDHVFNTMDEIVAALG